MGTGYTRNDTDNNIADGNVINAADFDGEFDAIVTAFSTTGHTHDGTSAEGGPVSVVGPAQDITISATIVSPKSNNAIDLGTDALEFKDLYLDGTAYIDGFGRDMLVATDKKVQFRDTAIHISSTDDGELDIVADGTIFLTADAITFGEGTDTDIVLTFNANTADGVITWMEDEDYFQFSDDILMTTTEKIYFTNTSNYIHSASAGNLDLVAATEIHLTATTINVDGALDFSGQVTFADGSASAPSISNTGDVNAGLFFSAADTMAFSAGGTAQFTMADGVIAPVTDSDVDLGTSSLFFKDAYLDTIIIKDTGTIGSASDTDAITIAADGAVTLSQNFTVNADTATFASANANDPLVVIKNTTNDTNGARLQFVKDKGAAGADDDVAGVIEFIADDAAQDQTTFAKITAQVADATHGEEGGRLSLGVASHDGEFQNGLVIQDNKTSSAEDRVDVIIGNGTDSVTTVAGNLDVTGVATATTFEPDGDTAAGDNAAIGYTSAEGLILTGQGSTSDIVFKNDADTTVFSIPTGTDDVLFPDNAKIIMGTGSDLQIYHDGSNSYIQDDGTGQLRIDTNGTDVRITKTNSEYMATFGIDGAVTLYHDNSPKFATSSAGIDVTGNAVLVTADSYLYSNGTSGGTTIDAGFRFETSTPKLEFWVNDGERASISSDGDLTVGDDLLLASDSAVLSIGADADLKITHDGTNGDFESAGKLTFDVAGDIFLDAGGNVGVGRSSPSSPLHVETTHSSTDVTAANTNSTVTIGNTAAGNNIYNAIKFSANQQDMYIMSFNHGTQASRRLGFFVGSVAGDATTDERLSITGDGNVGINQTSPVSKLNVTSTAHDNSPVFESTGTTQLWLRDTDVGTDSQRNWGFQSSGGDLNIVRANNDRASGFVTPVYIQQAPANSLIIDATGAITASLQPSFMAQPNSQQSNLGADGNFDDIAFTNERYDTNADYNTSTSVFTAPVAGRYLLTANVYLLDIDSAMSYLQVAIQTSTRDYLTPMDFASSDSDPARFGATVTVIENMAANDTAKVKFNQSSGSAQVDVATESYFCGSLLN